jgi:hypothetical protein
MKRIALPVILALSLAWLPGCEDNAKPKPPPKSAAQTGGGWQSHGATDQQPPAEQPDEPSREPEPPPPPGPEATFLRGLFDPGLPPGEPGSLFA